MFGTGPFSEYEPDNDLWTILYGCVTNLLRVILCLGLFTDSDARISLHKGMESQ